MTTWRSVGLTVLSAVMLLAGCGNESTASVQNADNGSAAQTTTQQITSVWPELTQDDMMEQSTLIVCGTVTDQSQPFQIIPTTGGDPSNFIDYTVTISDVLRGEASRETVTVRVQGGTVDGMTTVVDDAPELPADTELLLYLYAPGMGGQYNTEGDYYYVTGMWRGVYQLDTSGETDIFVNQRNHNDPQLQETWDVEQLYTTIETYTEAHPVDTNAARNKAIAQAKEELASGQITQEEYDAQMAELDTYATIKQ